MASILLVDDDTEDYLIMKQAFSDLGFDDILLYVDSGQKALDLLERNHRQGGSLPDIVVLDINMPIMNGPAVLRSMRLDSRFSAIPVVIYSTSIHPLDEKQCVELGAEYCITKPGSLDEIIRVGETLLSLCKKSPDTSIS